MYIYHEKCFFSVWEQHLFQEVCYVTYICFYLLEASQNKNSEAPVQWKEEWSFDIANHYQVGECKETNSLKIYSYV